MFGFRVQGFIGRDLLALGLDCELVWSELAAPLVGVLPSAACSVCALWLPRRIPPVGICSPGPPLLAVCSTEDEIYDQGSRSAL